ncbi:SH3 domain-containing protein [Streptacidiphilus sp. N1-3]|uniref:SH3 domain-containing protein n=1 Tax=Streptacidiphilus alkalitolerans TaxID=3342712 RepID=A0ABV6XB32_9ACTN
MNSTTALGRGMSVAVAGSAILVLALAGSAHAATVTSAFTRDTASARTSTYVDCDKYQSTTTLRVRTGPGTGYATIGQLGKGNTVDIIDSNSSGTWDRIRLLTKSTYGLRAGTVGWVSDAYLKIDNPCRTNINV